MNIYDFFNIVELKTKLVSISSIILAFSYIFYTHTEIQIIPAFLMFFSALFIDMGTTAFNSFYDYIRGLDDARDVGDDKVSLINTDEIKVLAMKKISPYSAFWVGIICFCIGGFLGLLLTVLTTYWLVPMGIFAALVGFFYSGGDTPISDTPLGELFAGGVLGGFLILCVFISQNFFDFNSILLMIAHSFWIASILSVNNACDLKLDKQNNRKTLAIIMGEVWASRLVVLLCVISFILYVIFAILENLLFIIPILIAFTITFLTHKKLYQAGFILSNKGFCMMNTMKSYTLYFSTISLCFLSIGFFM